MRHKIVSNVSLWATNPWRGLAKADTSVLLYDSSHSMPDTFRLGFGIIFLGLDIIFFKKN